MTSTTLKTLKDGGRFRLSKKSNVVYRLQRKDKRKAWFTSENSERTTSRPLSTIVFPVSGKRLKEPEPVIETSRIGFWGKKKLTY